MARPLVAPRTPDAWERGWQRTWKQLGFVPYELPPDASPAGQERDFLAEALRVLTAINASRQQATTEKAAQRTADPNVAAEPTARRSGT